MVQVQWSAAYATMLACCSADRKVAVLDVSRIGIEQVLPISAHEATQVQQQHVEHVDHAHEHTCAPPTQAWHARLLLPK